MPVRNDGIICRECGGTGCESCNDTGYSYMRYTKLAVQVLPDVVPMPYGKALPILINCYYPNEQLDEPAILCPNCGSENVCSPNKALNPGIADWFCISCQDSWCYEREH